MKLILSPSRSVKKLDVFFSLLVFFLISALFGAVAVGIQKDNDMLRNKALHDMADRVSEHAANNFQEQAFIFRRMAAHWNERHHVDVNTWKKDIYRLIEDTNPLLSVQLVSRDGGTVHSLYDQKEDEHKADFSVSGQEVSEALQALDKKSFYAYLKKSDTQNARLLFVVTVPVLYLDSHKTKREEGLIISFYDAQEFFLSIFSRITKNAYDLSLLPLPENGKYKNVVASVIRVGDTEIPFYVREKATSSQKDYSRITPYIVLGFGAGLALLSAVCFLVIRINQIRAKELAEANIQLAHSERMLRAINNNAAVPEAIISPDGHWISANQAMCDFLGYSEKELKKTDFQTLTHPDYLNRDIESLEQLANGQISTYQMEKIYIRKNGRHVWGLLNVSAVRNQDGSPRFYISQVQDITRQKENEEKFVALFEKASNPHMLLNLKDGIIDCNEATVRILGAKSKQEILGRHPAAFSPLFQPDGRTSQEVQQEIDKKVAETGFLQFEWLHRRLNGEDFYVDVSLTELRYGNQRDVLVIWYDLTEKKRLFEQLEKSNHELERFAFVASHDLQEPLRTICSFAELLEIDYADRLDDVGRKYTQIILTSGKRMKTLVEELLEYARIGSSTEMLALLDLKEVAEQVCSTLSVSIEECGAEVSIEDMPKINGSRVNFNTLFYNLVTNALKYRAQDRHPVIRIFSKETPDTWQVFVTDNGIGIQEEYLQQIFDPFKRLHTREEYPGTGMGLALCKKIVEERGGQIRAMSDYGVGSTFVFTIPKNTYKTGASLPA